MSELGRDEKLYGGGKSEREINSEDVMMKHRNLEANEATHPTNIRHFSLVESLGLI